MLAYFCYFGSHFIYLQKLLCQTEKTLGFVIRKTARLCADRASQVEDHGETDTPSGMMGDHRL